MLGPALIELDYLIRQHDPLIQAAAPRMRALLEQTTQQGVVILAAASATGSCASTRNPALNRTRPSATSVASACRCSWARPPA